MSYVHTPFPQQLVVEITAACDQQCIFCGRTYMDRPKKTMDPALFKRIVDEVARENPLTELWPTFMGEAMLLGKRLFELIRYARAAGCRKITMNSNGNKLDDEAVDGVLTAGFDRFIVSCDGHTKETYERVRRGGRFERLYGGLHRLIREIERRKLEKPILEIQFSVFDENEHEADDFVKYWTGLGQIVKTRPKLYWSGEVPGGESRVTFGPDRTPCLWSLDTAAVQWNGDMVICVVDCAGKEVVGNLRDGTLKQFWNGPLRDWREVHMQRRWDDLPPICRECPDWKTKRASAFFPNDVLKERYETYVRMGRVKMEEHLAPTDEGTNYSTFLPT